MSSQAVVYDQVPDPNAPQSAFAYPAGSATPGTPTGSEQVIAANGVLGIYGPLYITALPSAPTTPLQLSLPAPAPGSSKSNGNDNIELELINVSGLAHVITAGAASPNGYLNGGVNHTITFIASKPGVSVRLRAYNGQWNVTEPNGATIA
jgi:hypothetical protein